MANHKVCGKVNERIQKTKIVFELIFILNQIRKTLGVFFINSTSMFPKTPRTPVTPGNSRTPGPSINPRTPGPPINPRTPGVSVNPLMRCKILDLIASKL